MNLKTPQPSLHASRHLSPLLFVWNSHIPARYVWETNQIFAVRSQKTVTFVSEFPYRKIQVVLRLYKSLAEVLHGFDVDACSVGFDGQKVRAVHLASDRPILRQLTHAESCTCAR